MGKEGRCRLPKPFDRVTMNYVVELGQARFWYHGPGDQLVAAGAVEPHMLEVGGKGKIRADANGNYFSRSKLPDGRFRIYRRILSKPEHAACLPGMSLELIRAEAAERGAAWEALNIERRSSALMRDPSYAVRVTAKLITHPRFNRGQVVQVSMESSSEVIDLLAVLARRQQQLGKPDAR